MENSTQILNTKDIEQKIKRLAYEVYEDNYEESQLIFIGIEPNGKVLANKLKKQLSAISSIHAEVISLKIDTNKPITERKEIEAHSNKITNKVVVIVDDVANSGKTLSYALNPILPYFPKKIQIAVLVDRKHKLFPISADFVGISLSTTMKEHVYVSFQKANSAVYLK